MDTITRWIISLIQKNNIKAFYNCALWLKKRADALERDNYECQKCKARGGFSPANCVHHKKHLKKYPELALDLENLVSL
ncbi:HNH endonuclease [Clostridium cadaveris]|uniref:HNH endonuclease n=1 Tax=Clostridium cadaveris TaxID=1529 RepID=UPI001FAC8111|nr:HNH endonuclease [Clostridium cadaveris]